MIFLISFFKNEFQKKKIKNKYKKIKMNIKIVIFLFFCGFLNAQNSHSLFKDAVNLYNEAKYESASEKLHQILQNGEHSCEIYFNLGNCYYKQGKIPQSIFYFEKALMLSPSDNDIQNNLKIAKKAVVSPINPLPKLWIENVFNYFLRLFSVDGWAIFSIVLCGLFVISFVLYLIFPQILRKRLFFSLGLVFLFFSGVSFFSASWLQNKNNQKNTAILFSQEVNFLEEPNLKSQVIRPLYAGTKIEILETLNTWYRVKLEDGQEGWVEGKDFEKL